MAYESYPYDPRHQIAYPEDVDYVPSGAYAPAYDRSSYRPSVRAPYCGPRPVPMPRRSYESEYRGYDGFAGGRGGGFGNGYHHSMPEHHRSRGHGSRSRYGGGHGMHYSGIGGRQMVDPLYSYGHGY